MLHRICLYFVLKGTPKRLKGDKNGQTVLIWSSAVCLMDPNSHPALDKQVRGLNGVQPLVSISQRMAQVCPIINIEH